MKILGLQGDIMACLITRIHFLLKPPYPRVKDLRSLMNEFDLEHIPIIMAGGVWNLSNGKTGLITQKSER